MYKLLKDMTIALLIQDLLILSLEKSATHMQKGMKLIKDLDIKVNTLITLGMFMLK